MCPSPVPDKAVRARATRLGAKLGFPFWLTLLVAITPSRFAFAADQAAPESDKTEAADAPTPGALTAAKIQLVYLGKAYDEPVPLSLVDKILTDNGVQGARLAISDNNKSGRFLGQDFELAETVVPKDGDVAAKAKELLATGDKLIVADLGGGPICLP